MRLIVWTLRKWHQCGHLGPAVRLCYCDPFARKHWRETPQAFFEGMPDDRR